jgi:hypothetical protein
MEEWGSAPTISSVLVVEEKRGTWNIFFAYDS